MNPILRSILTSGLLAFPAMLGAQIVEWAQPSITVQPLSRYSSGLAFDNTTGVTVLFGGSSTIGSDKLNDTWIWHQGWLQVHPETSPTARQGPGMVFDEDGGNIVMFGGLDATGNYLNDTWIWDGKNWTQVPTAVAPPGRLLDVGGMTYDRATRSVVLFGGLGSGGTFDDTWTWNGRTRTWTQHFPTASPAPRRTVIAYDYTQRNVVLFGGDSNYVHYDDTWTWDGVNWTLRAPAASPSARTMGSFAYDTALGRVVLFGGIGSVAMNDTWYWQNGTWTQAAPFGTLPAPRWAAPMDYDPVSKALLLFGATDTAENMWLFTRK